MIDVLVAEDERPAREELTRMLHADARVGQVHAAASGAEALEILEQQAVRIAFLDIHMPGLSGLALARVLAQMPESPAIVFVTADDAHAVDAFDVRAADYLLKPVRPDRLSRAIGRVLESDQPSGSTDEVLAVTVGNTVRFVRRSEVRWVQAQGDYSRLHTSDGRGHLVRTPISELEQRWAGEGFTRVHRSYLVSARAVTEARLTGPEPSVSVGDIVVPVSRRLAAAVREALLPHDRGGPA